MKKKKSKKTLIFAILGIIAIMILILFLLKGCTKTKEYTVIFDANGGSYVGNVTVKENETVKQPLNPTREGYQFVGWYLGEELFDFDTKITKDITLKAHWEESGITLNFSSLNLKVGDTKQLEITSFPLSLKLEDFLFESSDSKIVTIDEKGNLKALKTGTVTITVKSKDGKYTKACTITVTEEEIAVESITITGSKQVTVGSSIQLSTTVKPSNATNKTITWSSSDSKIATVDKNGKVTGVKAGTVVITATTANGKKTTFTITVKAKSTSTPKPSNSPTPSQKPEPTTTPTPEDTTVHVSGVTINGERSLTLFVSDERDLTAVVTPNNAENQKITWSSSQNDVVSIDQNGHIKALKTGTVTITVTSEDGNKTDSITVIVKDHTYEVTLTALVLYGGDIKQYEVSDVTKDGTSFSDYQYIKFANCNYRLTSADKYILANNIKVNNILPTSATIVLNDGTRLSVSIKYGSRILEQSN